MPDVYAFLELEGIEGESQDVQYTDKIELLSVQFGAINRSSFGSGTGVSVGKGQLKDIQCTKFDDKSSPRLFQGAVTGTHIKVCRAQTEVIHG